MANILNILDKDTGKYVSVPAIQGASAYEVAVANGFKGTEQEWLSSLKGEGADVDLSTYATIDYVDSALEEVTVDIDNVNLEGYATEEWTKDYISNNLETISNGYYEPTDLKGEDITDDIIAVNGELPILPTYQGGTKYVVSGGLTGMWVNPNNESSTLYLNDYQSYDFHQTFQITDTVGGNVSDYYIYGAYNKDLLTKEDMLKKHKTSINKWVNASRSDGYFGSERINGNYVDYCGWSFYGDKTYDGTDATANDKWTSVHISTGSVSQAVQDKLDKIYESTMFGSESDGTPGIGYRRYPCVVIDLEPYTTYTINYTGDTEGENNYMKGLHYCLTNGTNGGGCNSQQMAHSRHLLGTYTSTFTTSNEMLKLILFVGRIKTVNAEYGSLTSDSSSPIDIDIVNYNINNLSLVQGNKTYEYYIDMIKDIDFDLSIVAMSMADESVYTSYNITIPYIMKPNQYIRFNREQDIFIVSRPLVKAVNMQIDALDNSNMNYKVDEVHMIGKWIDSKDIYRTVIHVQLPDEGKGDNNYANYQTVSITLPDTVDTVTNLRATRLSKATPPFQYKDFFGNNYIEINTTSNTYGESLAETRYFRMGVSTYLPTEDNLRFYSTLVVHHGTWWKNSEIAIVLEYTKYDWQEDGSII